MLVKFWKRLSLFLFIFICVAWAMAYVDYLKLTHGRIPIFCVEYYNSKTKVETFRGIFYKVERVITQSIDEPLVDSHNITYQILYKSYPLSRNYSWPKLDFTLSVDKEGECSKSVLYYADLDIKYYLYCFSSIELKEKDAKKSKDLIDYLKRDNQKIEDIVGYMDFVGISDDGTTEKYVTNDKELSLTDLVVYRCNKKNINDIYIAPKGTFMQEDFCTYKDDDFKFIWEIEEKEMSEGDETSSGEEEEALEVIYEDDSYRYEISKGRLDRIFIVTPKVRGKARTETPLRDILNRHTLTIDELIEKGLQCNKVDKAKEQEEAKSAEEGQ